MKAVIRQNAELSVRDIPEPTPEKGQALLKVLRCGICGFDLHMHCHCDELRSGMRRSGYKNFPSDEHAVVLGHEFCGEVLDYGAGSDKALKPGTRVCAMPRVRRGQDIDLLGMSGRTPGAYAERVLVQEKLMLAIPNGLSDNMAALTDPMALALHAVRRSEVKPMDLAVVVGCGAVGLAVICMLKARGVRTVVASDFSADQRQLAQRCGADVVVDLSDDAPYAHWAAFGFMDGLPALLEQSLGGYQGPAAKPKTPVIFECVGLPGALETIVDGAPLFSRMVVVGLCMQPNPIESVIVGNKEIDMRFVMGYSPQEFRDALHLMAEGQVRAEALVTGLVGLGGVAAAFDALADAEQHAKILIDPSRHPDELVAL